MTLLITGTHGFVGSNLVSALKSHYEIYGLDISRPKNTLIFNFQFLAATIDVLTKTIIVSVNKAIISRHNYAFKPTYGE